MQFMGARTFGMVIVLVAAIATPSPVSSSKERYWLSIKRDLLRLHKKDYFKTSSNLMFFDSPFVERIKS